MRSKLTSRKFWMSVAAFLGSIAASIAGIVTSEKWVTITGVVCGMLSAAIYAAVEAYTDAANSAHTVEHVIFKDDKEETVPAEEDEIIVEEAE